MLLYAREHIRLVNTLKIVVGENKHFVDIHNLVLDDEFYNRFIDRFGDVVNAAMNAGGELAGRVVKALEFLKDNLHVARRFVESPPKWIRELGIAMYLDNEYCEHAVYMEHIDEILSTLPIFIYNYPLYDRVVGDYIVLVFRPSAEELQYLESMVAAKGRSQPDILSDLLMTFSPP